MDSQSVNHAAVPTSEFPGVPSTARLAAPKKPKRVSTLLTLAPKATGSIGKYNLEKHADQERFLSNLAASWHRKLKDLKPQIKTARDLFKEMPRGKTLCECSSFHQFCEEKLHVTRQGVYKMLGDYHAKAKAKKLSANPMRRQPPKPARSKHDQQRRDNVTAAAIQFVEAEVRGDAEAAARAKENIALIVKSRPPSELVDDYDVRHEVLTLKRRIVKLGKLMLKLLGEIGKADQYQPLPADLMRVAATLRTELAVDAKSLGLDDGSVQ